MNQRFIIPYAFQSRVKELDGQVSALWQLKSVWLTKISKDYQCVQEDVGLYEDQRNN